MANSTNKKRTNDIDFVAAVVASKSNKEVAEKLKMTVVNVSQRIKHLRESGVQLPEFPATTVDGKRVKDIKGLNELIGKLTTTPEVPADNTAGEGGEKTLQSPAE